MKRKKNIFRKMPLDLKLEDPIRDEIFSPERLEQYAVYLSSELSISTTRKKGRSLLPRLEKNYENLTSAYTKLTDVVQKGQSISPAGEWFIDNFHIIEDQVREVREDLPEAYYRELPKVLEGELAGYPQVYVIALALVAHQDSHIDIEIVKRFLLKYQTVKPLFIGEVWAIAIALRLVLIENLSRLASQIVKFQEIREWADDCADQILSETIMSKEMVQEIKLKLEKELEKTKTCDCFIIVQLSKRLREQSSEVLPILEALDKNLTTRKLNFEKVLHGEYQRQAASQITVSNIVNSMRLLSNIDWQDFFESVNLIDTILKEDPVNSFEIMDFKSRDSYRHVIERIQKKTGISEIEIAREVITLSNKAYQSNAEDPREYHVGYYLIDEGVSLLEKKVGYVLSIKERIKRNIITHPNSFYFLAMFIMILFVITSLLFYAYLQHASVLILILIAFVSIVPISDGCLNLLNLIVTRLVEPRVLPKIDLDKNIPNPSNVFVIIPTILSGNKEVIKLLDGLEVRYLSNQEDNLLYALLTDFSDATFESIGKDQVLLDSLILGIDELNQKYSTNQKKFYLFHRKRLWNSSEQKWMGWERKRGKIHEFNRFLRGAQDTSFIIAPTYEELFAQIQYVITLDADTQLPRGSAMKLLGTILHPLNQPQFDEETGRVIRGYGILQPRISITPQSSERSWFAKIFSGHTGIDPYTTAVSDVYQDLFGEGIFTGKGLYDVDCFEKALAGRIPENSILSHDLFEGLFARTALTSDIEFMDDYPVKYEAFSKRQHRWTRGDWQILPWLVGNDLPLLSRWKIFDNLRRSLVFVMIFLWLILGWTILPGGVGVWSLITLLVLAFPLYIHIFCNVLSRPRGTPWIGHFLNLCSDFKINTARLLLSIIMIPHQAYLQVDAILRTLYRLIISKNNLLNWQTAAEVESILKTKGSLKSQVILVPILFSIVLYLFLFHFYSQSLVYASPLLLSWILFPIVIKKISQERLRTRVQLKPFEVDQLRIIARKTWNFFEIFVTEQDHWLAPDNYQEEPNPMIAHRTSPTNMGLLLLATCSAYNLGHIGLIEMLERLKKALTTMFKFERCFGHFYNWYDTETLQPLNPKYISTVDSGNLAGHLIAVKQICISISREPIISLKYIDGIRDTLKVVEEKMKEINLQSDNLLSLLENCFESCSLKNGSTLYEYKASFVSISRNLELLNDAFESVNYKSEEMKYKNISLWVNNAFSLSKANLKHINKFLPNLHQDSFSNVSSMLENHAPKLLTKWQRLIASLGSVKSFKEHQALCYNILSLLSSAKDFGVSKQRLLQVENEFLRIQTVCLEINDNFEELSRFCEQFISEMDFKIVFEKQRKLFSIGYNVENGAQDNSFYDLLASESRLASFIAIAKGDVPQSHWFHLGRQMTSIHKKRVLISWSASMFEYLMPLLVMRNYSNTLLSETQIAVVKLQQIYSKVRGIPWGVSESAYNARDLQMNYQYGPFGIPGIGLKRGLNNDTVVSPYSTALAALVSTNDILNNFNRLIKENLLTDYGFYESIDYTKSRIKPGQKQVIIKTFMVHHQGMIITALDNVLNSNVLQNHFHNDLMVRSSELLLQERTPKRVNVFHPRSEEPQIKIQENHNKFPSLRHISDVNTFHPETQVLSNTEYTVALNACGSGFSKCENTYLSRWNEESISETLGSYLFIEDVDSNLSWSSSFAPMNKQSDAYKTSFSEHKVEYWCDKNKISSHVEVIVSPEDNVELKRVTLINRSLSERNLNITSYLEPTLTTYQADIAHKAFSNLFIETEYIASKKALIAHRRKRSSDDKDVWAVHLVSFATDNSQKVQYETRREGFIGRTNDISAPTSITEGLPLSDTVGAVLDPIFSLRKQITLGPQKKTHLCFISGLTNSREEALRLIDRYQDQHLFDREDEMGWIQSQAELRHLNISFEETKSFQMLGNSLLYPCGPMRSLISEQNESLKPQSSLWRYGISGDIPILLVVIKKQHEIKLVRQLLLAHEYFRYKGILFDLVILSAESSTYRLELQDELLQQVRISGQQNLLNKHGGVFLLKEDSLPAQDLTLLRIIARIFINAENGDLNEQLENLKRRQKTFEGLSKNDRSLNVKHRRTIPLNIPKIQFQNGYGGFSKDGKEYIVFLKSNQATPAPWCNVIANEKDFGFLVSELGSTYTWSENSRENRITPWSNDPVSDPSGESLYIVDLESGDKWSPTPAPMKGPSPYLIRHGQGYTIFENNNNEIKQELTMFCSENKKVKINKLRLKNESTFSRELSLFYYVELVLGPERSKSAHHIVTKTGKEKNIFLAQNPFNEDFGKRITFIASSEEVLSYTCERKSFLGKKGYYKNPSALDYKKLDQKTGPGLNPCIAIQVLVELKPNEEKEISFMLGQASSEAEVYPIVNELLRKDAISTELNQVKEYWDKILNVLQVKTAFPEFDILINRWLVYQNLSCRVWARTAFYQSGGAFGFRDQLQDITSLLHCAPEVARKHIVLAAACQFKEGDVLHWWHPPSNKGVRTHFSDDLLWLPYTVATFVEVLGDSSIINEVISFVEGPELDPSMEDLYFQPQKSESSATLYDHCVKAIDRSLALGVHGLPLMGTGDWNDGMNKVGAQGRGESVWMAWFLITTLKSFMKICEIRKDTKRIEIYSKHVEKLSKALETTGWDGKWYKRAYFDDGSPLGSKENQECMIDSLTQSWAALSGVAKPEHLKKAMESMSEHLIKEKDQLVLLFTPPFDKSVPDPGYIKGYLPGIRENGGQYTHAAVWAAMGYAATNNGNQVFKVLSILNPINHSLTKDKAQNYAVEPYVISADVYSNPTLLGRGGWSWYTGSAGWYYRALTESFLGIYREGNSLRINPCLPNNMSDYQIDYKFGNSLYNIQVKICKKSNLKTPSITLDGEILSSINIPLLDDGEKHFVEIDLKISGEY